MSTNLIKWNDTDNRLTAYCSDDSGETEIGPVKWDDTNNKLELNCDSIDYQAKWNDTDNELEAQSVSNDCCFLFPGNQPCDECPDDNGPACFYFEVGLVNGIVTYDNPCRWINSGRNSCLAYNSTISSWIFNLSNGCTYDFCSWNPDLCLEEEVCSVVWDDSGFTCLNGGIITRSVFCDGVPAGGQSYTLTPCPDCENCPPS